MHPIINDFLGLFSVEDVVYDTGSATWDSDYKDWFIGVSQNWELDSCHHLSGYLGVAGLNYDENFNSLFGIYDIDEEDTDSNAYADYSLDFKGVGLRLGTFYQTTICDCFGAYFNVNGSILIGDSHSDAFFGFIEDSGEELLINIGFKDDGCCAFVPGYQLGLGLTYETCLCNVDLIFKIGYEFVAWYNLPDYRFFVEGIPATIGEGSDADCHRNLV